MERETFTIAIPEGFPHDARLHEAVSFLPNTPPKFRVLTPLHEKAISVRIGRTGQLQASSPSRPLIMIGDSPIIENALWRSLIYKAETWSFPYDQLLKGMALTVAVKRYEYVPKYTMPGDDVAKHGLALIAVRVEGDIPDPSEHEGLQEWIATRRALWEFENA